MFQNSSFHNLVVYELVSYFFHICFIFVSYSVFHNLRLRNMVFHNSRSLNLVFFNSRFHNLLFHNSSLQNVVFHDSCLHFTIQTGF